MDANQVTIGAYLAFRLEQLGLKHFFSVPGDYSMALLDELLRNKKLEIVSCCNELNAGYAADGYARAYGLSALVVTYSVGGLSAINAIAGAYAEDLPIIVISGAPGTDAKYKNQILHHTLANINYRYVRDIYSYVTAQAVTINHLSNAAYLIDQSIDIAINKRKPVYIEIACNLAKLKISDPNPIKFSFCQTSDQESLKAATDHAASLLNSAKKPVLVAGSKLRSYNAISEFKELTKASDYGFAVMPDAKGFLSEQDSNYIGIYWGTVSSPGCADVVESSDMYLFAGALFTDYTTTGYSALLDPNKLIQVMPDHVKLPDQVYNNIALPDFLSSLLQKIKPNNASLEDFKRIKNKYDKVNIINNPDIALTRQQLFTQVQKLLNNNTTVIVETGDAWFNGTDLNLPSGCLYEIQMQYGSIGWSVGATLGYALANQNSRRVIAIIGDGSFQISAQELSTIIRYKLDPIIILTNNQEYAIESAIHPGCYNTLKNWKYSELVDVFNAQDGNGLGFKVKTESELVSALNKATESKSAVLIEAIIDKNDCNKNLYEWGSRVAANNSKPPQCQNSKL